MTDINEEMKALYQRVSKTHEEMGNMQQELVDLREIVLPLNVSTCARHGRTTPDATQ